MHIKPPQILYNFVTYQDIKAFKRKVDVKFRTTLMNCLVLAFEFECIHRFIDEC